MTFQQMSGHASDIYRMAIEAELTGWGFYQEGGRSLWYPPEYPVDYGVGRLPSDIVNEVHGKHGDLLNAFQAFQQGPDPAAFDGPIAQMEQVLGELAVGPFIDPVSNDAVAPNGSGQLIQNIHDELLSWHGNAAEAFRTNFLNGLEDKTGFQWTLAWVLLQSLRAEKAIWQGAQKDVDRVAHATIDALAGEGGLDATDSSSTEVFGAITDVASIALPGVGNAITIFTAARTIFGLDPHGAAGAVPMLPEQVAEIISTMRDSIDTVSRAVREKEEDLHNSLRDVRGAVLDNEVDYVLPRPALANAGNGYDQFGDNY